ncbi:hypothetical protein V3C99_011412 [Haemonchus contortus]|uniref:SUI1 domain-containing protein n=1 Tax=Haemonchus contortus TaxID=6289 RepID=A0A7I4Y847_HAECO
MEGSTVEPKNSTFLTGNGFRRLELVEPRRKYIRGVTIGADPAASCREEIAAKLKVNYADVFRTGIGRCTKTKATLQVESDAHPVFKKKRPCHLLTSLLSMKRLALIRPSACRTSAFTG